MNPRDQRIAIAEANDREWTEADHQESGYKSWQDFADQCGNEVLDDEMPDYLEDLNAMHEVEKGLTAVQRIQFADILYNSIGKVLLDWSNCYYPGEQPTIDLDVIFQTLHATASQRAEAYLRTIGKWKD